MLTTKQTDVFKTLLAITFTNKAVNEMKARIIKNLTEFSNEKIQQEPSPMFLVLKKDLNIDGETLQKRAKKVLKKILHNYAFFDVVTIDKFNHRLIRTFAHDLKLPMNFEVVLDTEMLLAKAVDNLLQKAGDDKKLTKILLDFALEKINDDKTWDIGYDLNKIAKLLLNENMTHHLKKMDDKTIDDFLTLQQTLRKKIAQNREKAIKKATEILELLQHHQLEFSYFFKSYIPKFFKRIADGDLSDNFNAKWKNDIHETAFYPKTASEIVILKIDAIKPKIIDAFLIVKNAISQLQFLKNAYQNTVPLSLLNAIQKEVNLLKEEENLLLISEFNKLISETIKNEPAPFIYERLGEKYRHYFVDEFQDTSQMQWQNLVPLIGNALESETLTGKKGSLLLVGDAKQAVYRWRGGKAEQFISLSDTTTNPFYIDASVEDLPTNFRSFDEIIHFNNEFFQHISTFFDDATYKNLYAEKSTQQTNDKKGGYIQLSFIDATNKEDEITEYTTKTLTCIEEVIDLGYAYSDICILTQKNKEIATIADFLASKNIKTIAPDTLLLKHSPKVCFINNLIAFALHPTDKTIAIELLDFIASIKNIEDKHPFFKKNLSNCIGFLRDEYHFNIDYFLHLPFYDAIQYVIKTFQLAKTSDAYIHYYLETVLEFSEKKQDSFAGFLSFWEQKKDTLSIITPQGTDAIQLMTIHKAKGLEFPIVIYPFANTNIYEEIEPKIWFPIDENEFCRFSELLVSKNKNLMLYNDVGKELYESSHSKLQLDRINILYVALTRAISHIYIISKKEISAKGTTNNNKFSGLFIDFLNQKQLWNENKNDYFFGKQEYINIKKEKTTTIVEDIPSITNQNPKQPFKIVIPKQIFLETSRTEAIEKGNAYHIVLSKIKTEADISAALQFGLDEQIISKEDEATVHKILIDIIHHPDLKMYYKPNLTIYNEQEIITKNRISLRLDRIIIEGNKATIIDYKTGSFNTQYKNQLEIYEKALSEMGFKVANKILVFINDDIKTAFL